MIPLPLMSAFGFQLTSLGSDPYALASTTKSARETLKSPLRSPGIVTSTEPPTKVLSAVFVSP